MTPEEALKRVEYWQGLIRRAAEASGRDPEAVRLVPASKTVPAEKLRLFHEAGLDCFGENRIQEAKAKIPDMPSACRWHFIGGLQRNKARDAVAFFDLIHSVDSLELAEELDKRAAAVGKIQKILVEVNVAGEASKHGVPPGQVKALVEAVNALTHLEVHGLMTVAPFFEETEKVRPFFRSLRELRDAIQDETGIGLPELSMGMTHDYAEAIAEGATIVRVGSGLFGERKKTD